MLFRHTIRIKSVVYTHTYTHTNEQKKQNKSETYREGRQELLDVIQINTIILESALHQSD